MKVTERNPAAGVVEWTCPSNIAIVKYWGKRAVQLPMNPSISLTLSKALTRTRIEYTYDPDQKESPLSFTFEGREAPAFQERIAAYIHALYKQIPLLEHTSLRIDSSNTFPHSSGIASSASAFGALALCLLSLKEAFGDPMNDLDFRREASSLARLGSGSAARSIFPGFSLWGACKDPGSSSDEFAIALPDVHECFRGMKDSILIVESGRKKVSSTAGHGIMKSNPFASIRFQQARNNIILLRRILASGDWQGFISLMEEEALSLHAMMMTGKPGYMLMQPGTLSIIEGIREFRKKSGVHAGFTLDAGANVHLIYDQNHMSRVMDYINSELLQYCDRQGVIHDQMGDGPEKTII